MPFLIQCRPEFVLHSRPPLPQGRNTPRNLIGLQWRETGLQTCPPQVLERSFNECERDRSRGEPVADVDRAGALSAPLVLREYDPPIVEAITTAVHTRERLVLAVRGGIVRTRVPAVQPIEFPQRRAVPVLGCEVAAIVKGAPPRTPEVRRLRVGQATWATHTAAPRAAYIQVSAGFPEGKRL